MVFRTDIAKEACEELENGRGFTDRKITYFGVEGSIVEILTEAEGAKIGKKCGRYYSFETNSIINRSVECFEFISRAISKAINELIEIKHDDNILVVGLGNESMTPDSVGPKTVKKIFVTKHILDYFDKENSGNLISVCALAPGVLGVTGIESSDIIQSVCKKERITKLIIIDALASRRTERMFSSIQITDAGIEPGAGIGNKRSAINRETLGIPVIAIGIPTVIYASSLIRDAIAELNINDNDINDNDMIVTPKEVDVVINDSAKIIADGINLAIQKRLSLEEINAYMS